MQTARGASLTSGQKPVRVTRGAFWAVALTMFLVDQGTKQLALHKLSDGQSVELLGQFFQFTLVFNPGAAFGTGTSYTPVLTVFAMAAAVVVLVLSRRIGSLLWAVGLGALLGGIAGNLSDRMFRAPGPFRGYVVDFLHLTNWPVFNVADICINVAAGVIILQTFRGVSLSGARESQDR